MQGPTEEENGRICKRSQSNVLMTHPPSAKVINSLPCSCKSLEASVYLNAPDEGDVKLPAS